MSEARKHHPFGPSKLQNLEACPCWGSIDGDSEKARLGTLQHNVVESGEDDMRLSDDEAAAAAECIDFFEHKKRAWEAVRTEEVNTTLALMGWAVAEAEASVSPVKEFSEIYLPIDDCRVLDVSSPNTAPTWFVGTTGGYLDKGLIDHTGTKAMLFDWKFGQWQVESADKNMQGIAYALGVFKAYPKVAQVEFYFKQPHIQSISHATFKRADVPKLYLRVLTVVQRAQRAKELGDFSMANPTVPGCLFCANIALCPAVTAFACKVGHKFHPVAVPEDITPSKVHDPRNSTLGMRLASLVTTWASAFKSLTSDRALRGDAPIPEGYEITKGRGRRKIENAATFREVALRYLTAEQYDATVEPQLGKVESAISDTAVRGQKSQTLHEFKELLVTTEAVKLGEAYPYLKAKTKSE